MRAAISARVSTDEQAEKQVPIRDQVEACRKFAEARGWTVVRETTDEGISGAVWPRPGLASLLELAEQGEIDTLLVWDVSRLARDRNLFGHLAYSFSRLRVKIISVSEPEASDLEVGLKALMAGEYRERLRADITRAMRAKAERKEYTGGRRLYGYRWTSKTEREIVPEEAAHVARIFEMADPAGECAAWARISREMDWELQRVRRTLRHPGYAGAYTCFRHTFTHSPGTTYAKPLPRESQVIIWDAHEPIVPRDRWERVQERIAENASKRAKNHGRAELPLTGLLCCGLCGGHLRVVGMHRIHGVERHYYRCMAKGCRGVGRVPVDGWTELLLSHLIRHLQAPALARAIADELNSAYRAGVKTGVWEAEIRRLERSEAALREVIASGEISDTRALAQDYERTRKALERARAALSRARRRAGVMLTLQAVQARLRRAAYLLDGMKGLPARATRPVLHSLVESVIVQPGGGMLELVMSSGAAVPAEVSSLADVRGSRNFRVAVPV